jgi:hypothetical protein
MIYNRDSKGWYSSGSWLEDANDNDHDVYEKKHCGSCVEETEHERGECLSCHKKALENRNYWWASNSCWINNNKNNNSESVDREEGNNEDNEDEE